MNDPLPSALSLDASFDDDEDGGSFAEFIPDEAAECAFDAVEKLEQTAAIKAALDALDDAERQIIYLRYWRVLTQPETAQTLKIGVAEAKRLELSALRKLRHPSISRTLKSFL